MRLNKSLDVMIVLILLSSFLLVGITTGEESIENRVDANIDVEFVSATDLKINVNMDVSKLYLTASGRSYTREDIQAVTNTETMGAIKYALKSYLTTQMQQTFEFADITAITELPSYENDRFYDEYDVNLTSVFFDMNETVNAYDFINGVLDIGAIVAYDFIFKADPGWNNTYTVTLLDSMNRPSTDGKIVGDGIQWKVENGDGENPTTSSQVTVKLIEPTTPKSEFEDIDLEFELDTRNVRSTSFKTNILAKHIDISNFDILPAKITDLSYVPSDGIRLFVDNGLISWDDFYQETVKPVEQTTTMAIENSPFNQTLEMSFNWDADTTTNSSDKYVATTMNNDPPIKAEFTDNDVNLQICSISTRALFGLVNAGATANISAEDVNFGEGFDDIGYQYTGYLHLPDNIYLAEENTYEWDQNGSISGKFDSPVSPEYNNEEIETLVEIEISSTDLNLLSFFTGHTELTLGLYMQESRDYNVATVPNAFNLPEKLSLDYLNSDAFRVCVEENVFNEEDVSDFLTSEKDLFEDRLKNILSESELEIEGHIDRDAFEESLALWDGEIANMDAEVPVNTVSYVNTPYPLTFGLSLLPPDFNISNQNFSFKGIKNQSVTYKVVFPHGIERIEFSDSLDRAVKGETDDGRAYLEVSFGASESGLSDEVTCKMYPSALFVMGVFMPCIISFIITIILIIVIYIIRKKRRRSKGMGIVVSEEEDSGYEEQNYYVPPPPPRK